MPAFELWIGNLARQIVRRVVRVYYPDIEITDRERIPATGPALFVANHANSLIDPVIIGISVERPVHFLAKAPLFDIPVLGTVLGALGMIPAFRGIDDPSQIKRNLSSLTAGAEYLVKGEAVGLFPEGKSHDLIKVEQVRSGASRIVVRALQDGAGELLIVPVGINYERKEDFRSSIWVRVGEPIHGAKWMQAQGDDERRAMRSLTSELDRRLKEAVVHLNEESWEPLLHDLEVLRPAPPERAGLPAAPLRQRKRIADAINYFLAHDRPLVEGVAAAIQQHRERLAAAGISIRATILELRGPRLFFRMAWKGLWALLGLVPATLGLLHHLVPFLLVQSLAPRLKTPGRSTLALARLGLSIPAYAAWYFFVWRWMAACFLPWVAWTWILAMPFAGVFALHYCRRLLTGTSLWWNELGILFRSSRLKEFRSSQLAIRQRLKELADEYAKVSPPESAPLKSPLLRETLFRVLKWTIVFAILALGIIWGLSFLRAEIISERVLMRDSLSGHEHKYDDVRCAQFGLWQGARRAHTPRGSVTDEQRSHRSNSAQPSGRQFYRLRCSLLTDPLRDMRVARASGRKIPCRERHRIYVHDH